MFVKQNLTVLIKAAKICYKNFIKKFNKIKGKNKFLLNIYIIIN